MGLLGFRGTRPYPERSLTLIIFPLAAGMAFDVKQLTRTWHVRARTVGLRCACVHARVSDVHVSVHLPVYVPCV